MICLATILHSYDMKQLLDSSATTGTPVSHTVRNCYPHRLHAKSNLDPCPPGELVGLKATIEQDGVG